MPYSSVKELPPYVQTYSTPVKRQWMHVFNTIYKKNGESRAVRAANSVLKKRLKSTENNSTDRFNMLVDLFLNNLQG